MIEMSIPMITIAVYLVLFGLKSAFGEWEAFKRLIPLVALMLGALLGGLTGFIEEGDLVTKIIIGGVSGLAATGGDQVVKQLFKS